MRATLLPRFREWGEVLAVRGPGDKESQHSPSDDVEGVVPGIHDSGNGDEASGEGRDEHKNRFPRFSTSIQDVELTSQVKREESKARE